MRTRNTFEISRNTDSWIVSLVSLLNIADSYVLSSTRALREYTWTVFNRPQHSFSKPGLKIPMWHSTVKKPSFYRWPLYFYLTLNQLRHGSSSFFGWSFEDLFRSSAVLDVEFYYYRRRILKPLILKVVLLKRKIIDIALIWFDLLLRGFDTEVAKTNVKFHGYWRIPDHTNLKNQICVFNYTEFERQIKVPCKKSNKNDYYFNFLFIV